MKARDDQIAIESSEAILCDETSLKIVWFREKAATLLYEYHQNIENDAYTFLIQTTALE